MTGRDRCRDHGIPVRRAGREFMPCYLNQLPRKLIENLALLRPRLRAIPRVRSMTSGCIHSYADLISKTDDAIAAGKVSQAGLASRIDVRT